MEILTPGVEQTQEREFELSNRLFAWFQADDETELPEEGVSTISWQRIDKLFGDNSTLEVVRTKVNQLDSVDERTAVQLMLSGFDESIMADLFDRQVLLDAIGKLTQNAASASSAEPEPRHIRRRVQIQQASQLSIRAILGASDDSELTWQDKALCAQTDPEAFFPEKGGSTREAKKVCASCEVRAECLDYALKRDERFGVWGGLSERERRKFKHRAV